MSRPHIVYIDIFSITYFVQKNLIKRKDMNFFYFFLLQYHKSKWINFKKVFYGVSFHQYKRNGFFRRTLPKNIEKLQSISEKLNMMQNCGTFNNLRKREQSRIQKKWSQWILQTQKSFAVLYIWIIKVTIKVKIYPFL